MEYSQSVSYLEQYNGKLLLAIVIHNRNQLDDDPVMPAATEIVTGMTLRCFPPHQTFRNVDYQQKESDE